MSLVQEILYIVSDYPGGYRTIYDLVYGSRPPRKVKKKTLENNLRNTLSRMKRNGLLSNLDKGWSITKKGKEFLSARKTSIKSFFRLRGRKKETASKQVIIVFDIPEKRRRYRDWLRFELVGFGFEPIQKSVWFGPNLPQEFIEYLDEIDLLKYVKFFKATEDDLV